MGISKEPFMILLIDKTTCYCFALGSKDALCSQVSQRGNSHIHCSEEGNSRPMPNYVWHFYFQRNAANSHGRISPSLRITLLHKTAHQRTFTWNACGRRKQSLNLSSCFKRFPSVSNIEFPAIERQLNYFKFRKPTMGTCTRYHGR